MYWLRAGLLEGSVHLRNCFIPVICIKHTLSGRLHSLELHRRCDSARSIYKLLSDQENGSTSLILGLEACVPVDLEYIN
jgi:hypothetical protein